MPAGADLAPDDPRRDLDDLGAAIESALIEEPFVRVSGVMREVAPTHYRVVGLSAAVKLGDRVGPADDDRPTAVDPADPGYGDYVEVVDVINGVLAGLSPDHRTVVELVVFQARSAREAADAVPGMTEANAYQVVSRFRRDLRAALADDDGPTL